MSYTYTEPSGGVFASPVSEVRFLLGDTSPASPFSLTDSEIEYLLAQNANNVRFAAADAAYKMGTKYTSYSSSTSKTVGNLTLVKSYGDSANRYFGLSDALRNNADLGSKTAPAGPIYETVGIQFHVGQFDNPSTAIYD